MDNCPTSVVPELIEDKCKGKQVSSDCTILPEAFPYLELPENSTQTDFNNNVNLAVKAINGRLEELEEDEESRAEQNNFVRRLKIGDVWPITKESTIQAILALPIHERTIAETDSKWNISIGSESPDGWFDFKVYELVNIGKGVVTNLTAENLLDITQNLQEVLDRGENVVDKRINFQNVEGLRPSSLTSISSGGIHTFKQDAEGNRGSALDMEPNRFIISSVDHSLGWTSNTITYSQAVPSRALTIKFPNFTENSSNGTLISYPGDLGTAEYTFMVREDLCVTSPVTLPITLSNLNLQYSRNIVGFRVQCPEITTGGLIYEKTRNGWIQYPITKVT